MSRACLTFGILLSCFSFIRGKPGEHLEGAVRYECRDSYLWVRVASPQQPRFEVLDGEEVHAVSEELAARCGYTVSSAHGVSTLRASFYSCFTQNQNDQAFGFRLNVLLSDGGGQWTGRSVSTVCSAPDWTHREISCEENYMEVNVNRESGCGAQRGEGGPVWQEAMIQAQMKASLTWQLMFLRTDGQVTSMSVAEAQSLGYSVSAAYRRVVFRSPYKQPHAELVAVDGIPVETIQVSLFFKQKLLVVMMDMSVACSLGGVSSDDAHLLWSVPWVLSPLVGDGAEFDSRSLGLGPDGSLLDEAAVASRGLSVVQQGALVEIKVPFGAEGVARKGSVLDNVYKETFSLLLLFQHVFSLIYEDGSSLDTKLRTFRLLESPPICRRPFVVDQTTSGERAFRVHVGNVPADVILEEVWINGKRLMMMEKPEPGLSVTPLVHANGSRAFELRLPFSHAAVRWTNLGGGVLRYYIDTNFTLTLAAQKRSYYHHSLITAQILDAFPPEITAQCLEAGISFSVVRQSQSLWEVGVDREPLTSNLVTQRGYRLHDDGRRTVLEVPVFSVGFTYEEINLSNFYGTFKLLLRDSKTLEVQASTSKRCLFRTQDMIVCSSDGTMTVVTTPTVTWPTVTPQRTTLLDRNCKPKETDRSRVLFEFKLDSCGTRTMTGDWYVVYENEILHDRMLIADGPNFISRESQFKVTVRCFYPLGSVNRLAVERRLASPPGFGSIKVFESKKEAGNKPCPIKEPQTENRLPDGGRTPEPHPAPLPIGQDKNSQTQSFWLSAPTGKQETQQNPETFNFPSPSQHQDHRLIKTPDWPPPLQEPHAGTTNPKNQERRSHVAFKVHTVRVKPPSKFASADQKPQIKRSQHAEPQTETQERRASSVLPEGRSFPPTTPEDPDLKDIQGRMGCRDDPQGASVNQGIVRGNQIGRGI